MSAVPAIIQAEADLRRRLQAGAVQPLEQRVVGVEAVLLDHETRLGGHDLRLDGHDNILAQHGLRLTAVEAAPTSLANRMTAVEDDLAALDTAGLIALDARLDTVEGTLTTHGTRLTTAEADVVALAGRASLLESGLRVVTNAAQLAAAIAIGGRIGLLGMITVTATVQPTVAGTQLLALNDASGITYAYAFGSNHSVVKPAAENVTLYGLRITTGNPLTEVTTTDIGIDIDDSPTATVSRLHIERCNVYGVATPIARAQFFTASPPPITAAIARGIKIIDNDLHDFTYSGIFIAENIPGITISGNRIHGRLDSVSHSPIRNGIWLGQNASHAKIQDNEITTVGSHGLEYWNSQTDALTVNGNDMSVITGNQIYELLSLPGGSFAISAFGSGPLMIAHNICRTASIGIEVYNDYVNKGRLHILHNHIEDISSQGMSLNGVTNAHIAHNYIKDVPSLHGMQIINGGRDIEIHDNVFVDAGKYPIFINSLVSLVDDVETVNNGWITLIDPIAPERWVINGQIWFFDLGGSVELNDKFFTISEYDIPNRRFRIGYDLSGVTTFTSGGSVRESYRRITIDNNKFYFTDPATDAGARALYLLDLQDSFVTNNKSFVASTLGADVGKFQIGNAAARVHNGTADVTSLPSGSPFDIGGSNFRKAYDAPLT